MNRSAYFGLELRELYPIVMEKQLATSSCSQEAKSQQMVGWATTMQDLPLETSVRVHLVSFHNLPN